MSEDHAERLGKLETAATRKSKQQMKTLKILLASLALCLSASAQTVTFTSVGSLTNLNNTALTNTVSATGIGTNGNAALAAVTATSISTGAGVITGNGSGVTNLNPNSLTMLPI